MGGAYRSVGAAVASQALALMLGAAALTAPAAARADMFASASTWNCLANEGGAAAVRQCSASRHDNQITYNPGLNEFYGPLRQAGQCLDVQGGRVLFTSCNGSKSQIWKLSAAGQLNNEMGQCVAQSGGTVAVRGCPGAGTWSNATYRTAAVAGLNVAKGTPLKINGSALVNASTGVVLDPKGGDKLKASGLITNDGAGLIAAGGGNVATGTHVLNLIAAGAGN